MTRLRRALPFLGLLILGGAAPGPNRSPPAAPPSGAPDVAATPEALEPFSSVVADLEIIGRRPGPALWRVRNGESEVVIVGGLSPLPHLLQWDETRVKRALGGSTLLLLPPSGVHLGFFDIASLVLRQGALKSGRGGLEASLDPVLRSRFERVVASLRLDPKKYQQWKPAIAGLLLIGDFYRAAGLSQEKPGTTLAKLAKAEGVEVRTAAVLKFKPLFETAARMTTQQNAACLGAALDEIEWEAAHARPAADAWAVGDLKGVRANTKTLLLDRCLMQLPSVEAAVDQGAADGAAMIGDALKRPTHTVALVDLAFLLRPNGVLDRLKAAGDEITVPGD